MEARISGRLAGALVVLAAWLAGPVAGLQAQEVKLKVSHYLPPAHVYHTAVLTPWIQEVKGRTGGKVDIAVFPGGSLCKPPQQYDCARSGIADIAFGIPGWTPGRFPRTSVLELPFLFRTAAVGSQMLADLWEKYLQRDYDDVHILHLNTAPAFHIHTRTRPVRTMEDLKGLKIRAPSALVGDLLGAFGATNVGMPPDQIYEATSQGVIDGFVLTFEALLPFRLHEVSRYHLDVGMSTIVFAAFMNKARYTALPPDVRKALDETTAAAGGYWKRAGQAWDRAEARGRQAVVDRKQEILSLTREERNRWRQRAREVEEKWAAGLEARGLPGRALAREARELAARYGEGD